MGLVQTLDPGGYTMGDLDALPDDGKRRELVDGMLLVTPAPLPIHQTAVLQLGSRLLLACPKSLKVFVAPLDFRPTAQRSLQPDVLVCRKEDVGPTSIERPLLLAVEILSSSTRMKDLLLKRGVYEESGVVSYWMFDPMAEQLTVLELVDGHYVERAVVKGSDAFEAELPFPVRVVPAELVD
ncbi:Uma2 family endonuclease [Kribbella voronezhensis]|uniref:Uma2 family endonuclease n=1 Tax=Kribbella voronezhensis TaxID=2512212 RepID=A0A4R7TH89_9ACTN|nr:Uma2 family endonuclease [Kribbella voronezhensis]TDU91645.1 Uma2 family endonuclease [Kribbella voronezhensis]